MMGGRNQTVELIVAIVLSLSIAYVIISFIRWIYDHCLAEDIVTIPIKQPEVVPCSTCRHLVYRTDAQERRMRNDFGISESVYFCKEHRVLWKHKEVRQEYAKGGIFTGNLMYLYYREVECDENGKVKK